MAEKLWGGAFTAQTTSEVEQFTASIQVDVALAYEDILGSMAHATLLYQSQLLTEDEHYQIQQGLKEIANDLSQNDYLLSPTSYGVSSPTSPGLSAGSSELAWAANQNHGQLKFTIQDEDIHMNIERILMNKIGEVAKKLHTARSRNDQVALDLHLYLRKKIVLIVELLLQFQQTLFALAKTHHKIIIPGYTHLQRAQPIYLSQHWLAYLAMFQRDIERLMSLWTRVNISPLGAAALAGTSFALDRYKVAQLLNFDDIYMNTLDAVSDRDFIVEFLSASALIMMHFSRLSEELILWSSQEFNFIQFDEGYATGSSIMPQKKNPDIAELARGKTGRVYGALLSVLTMLKGLPLAYNKDMQEDKEPLFDTIKTLTAVLSIYPSLLSTLKINDMVMRESAQCGHLNATTLAEYLVKQGLPFRSAHGVVGKMVAYCLDLNCRLEDLALEKMQSFSSLIKADVYEILAIENAVAACFSPSLLKTEREYYQTKLNTTQYWVQEKKELISSIGIQ